MRATLMLLVATLLGCDPISAEAFKENRALDLCVQVIPACPGLYAACVLDETRYTEQEFPGAFSFVVEADPEATIEVLLYIVQGRDVGLETQIFWNEPGCSDVYAYDSEGRNLFAEAEDTGIISKSKRVFEGGEHLIEIISDMQAHTLVSVDVHEPEN